MSFNKILYSFLFVFIPLQGMSQHRGWDYPQYPQQDFSITHADGQIQIDETGVINGNISYDVVFKNSFADTLFFDAVELDIRSVEINNSEAGYVVSDDRLAIVMAEPFQAGSEAAILINYTSQTGFAFHRSENNVLWASSLPKTTSHWLPVPDNPRTAFTAEFEFRYPSGNQLIFNGRRGSGELATVDEETVVFTTETPVSASGLRLIIGSFEYSGSSVSDLPGSSVFAQRSAPQMYLYSELPDQGELLQTAAEYYSNVRNYLGKEFPFDDLHIVYLEDSQWEVSQTGAGIVYLFENEGDISHQLQTGIISQWVGESVRAVNWQHSEPVLMMQAFLLNEIFDAPLSPAYVTEPYDVYSAHARSEWQQFFEDDAPDQLKEVFGRVIQSYTYNSQEITDWNLFANELYAQGGRPWFSGFAKPVLEMPENGSAQQAGESDSNIAYSARIQWDEGSERAEIFFDAEETVINELVTVQVEEVAFNGTREHEITFTGASDGVAITVGRVLENLKLTVIGRNDVTLKTDKPMMFWIYQLQNDDDPERRREAAEALAYIQDNPDIQLALNDLLRNESDVEVYAELLRSIGTLTNGASGTHERFMQHLGDDQPTPVRIAAVDALGNYPGNDMVISRLRSVIIQANNRELRRQAIRSLWNVTDAEQFVVETEPLLTREQVLYDVPQILNIYAENGNPEKAVEIADELAGGNFPLSVRMDFIALISQYDTSPDNWAERLPVLLEDPHPAIRYQAVQALELIPQNRRAELVQVVLDNEYDERVRRVAAGL